jgi:hypothetical protein
MASTDTRSGFRLPWSSDRSHEEPAADPAADPATEDETARAETTDGPPAAWPDTDLNAALGLDRTEQRPPEPVRESTPAEEAAPMVEQHTAVAPAPAPTPRRTTKLMADLTAAIRATAEAAREQALSQVRADVQQVVEGIRSGSTEGAADLKHRSEADIAAIREWSKAEIARIREETESRIATRKSGLDEELAAYAAAVEHRVEAVQAEVLRFEAAMDSYLERLGSETDPARVATMAEEMPEAPSFDAWADQVAPDVATLAPDDAIAVADAEPVAEWGAPTEAVDETPEDAAATEAASQPVEAEAEASLGVGGGWTEPENAWGEPSAAIDGAAAGTDGDDDVQRWAAGETPDGFPTDESDAGDPVDRGAIMAALEAAAEAVVAAEAAAESADQAEAAADVAETAAELLKGRAGGDDDLDPDAQAAMNARMDAGGFDTESFADRLASLLPGHGEGAAGDEQRTTQVVVSGLVSVASIASFKRHLARVAGVQNVAVASGPEGEFVFNLTHRAELSFRDAIPTMPGFAARVTSTADGVVNVTARDPEAEG